MHLGDNLCLINSIRPFIEGLFNKGLNQCMFDLLHAMKVATKMDVLLNQVWVTSYLDAV